MKQLPLGLGERIQSFDNFAAGANGAALDALRAAAPGAAPIYLWGPPGCGKTHLLRSLGHQARTDGRLACSFETSQPPPWGCDEAAALVLLDGCESFDAAQQHAAFALFVQAQAQGAAVVAAGRLPPVDLPLREDLRTRLGWGLVFQLEPLGEAQARATLEREARCRGIALGDELMAYLLTRFARDLGSLMRLLDALDDFALERRRAVTVPLLRQMLAEREGAERQGASA